MSFEEKLAEGIYHNALPYGKRGSEEQRLFRERDREINTEFMTDCIVWLKTMGVPEQYAAKVYALAYDNGHSEGFGGIVNHALDLVEIFK